MEDIIRNPDFVESLGKEDLLDVLERSIKILNKEKAIVEVKSKDKIVFVGDTHGDFEITKEIVQEFFDEGTLVFLGDYIDREPIKLGSIFNITYLLVLKTLYPKKIYLLKGNHESNYVIPCYPYEFEMELIQRYGSTDLHQKFVEVFSLMPLMFLGKKVFAAHGGIPVGYNMERLRKLDKSDRDAIELITWSDPEISPTFRGAGYPFNEKDLEIFLKEMGANVFIRGHDYNTLGFSIYGNRCLTIFSSSRYKEMGNKGILVAIAEREVRSVDDLKIKDFSCGVWKDYKVRKV